MMECRVLGKRDPRRQATDYRLNEVTGMFRPETR
ncbi:hypothetical protein HRbin11_02291 [bacterium HR11]|nr:hypothetical protein HRbin11_02291 [bacterium HR11]